MTTAARRPYRSPLREEQAQRTRDVILDALTDLLAEHRVDEVSTKQIAERAGVSLPTVYRHFPDRAALVEGLANRVDLAASSHPVGRGATSLDDLVAWGGAAYRAADEHYRTTVAEAVLNSDPRRFSNASRRRSEEMAQLVRDEFPEMSADDHLRITALFRTLASIQTWLRMREEFGLTGDQSGPVVQWAIATLLREIRAGNFPSESQ